MTGSATPMQISHCWTSRLVVVRSASSGTEKGDDEAEQGPHLEPDVLDKIVIKSAAELDGFDDGGEVVVGDHPDPDAGGLGGGDRSLGGGAGRIDDPHEGEQFQVIDEGQQVGGGVKGRGVEVLARGGHHPQPLPAQPPVLGQVQLPEPSLGGDRPRIRVVNSGGARQELIGCAFHKAADYLLA
jgi:hypothetical protein